MATKVYFPLHHPPNLQSMLNNINGVSSVFAMNLSNNGITHLSTKKMELIKVFGNFKHLKSLDLRANKLILSALHGLSILSLQRVYIDGNPLCSFYENEKDYVSDIKGIWPDLVALDGCRLVSGTRNAPCIRRHYLVMPSAETFLDQFLIHFFSIFDSSRRDLLAGMYHSKAMLSMSVTFLDEQSTSEDSCLNFYMGQNRNIKKISDLSKVDQHLHEGARQIMEFYAQFPRTKHNPNSFCVDIIQYSDERVQMSISGNYIEMVAAKELPRFFKRVFHLVKFHDAYLIVNEMLYVNNCTTEQALELSVLKVVDETEALDLHLCTSTKLAVFNDEQRLGMMKKLSDLTGMNVLWSMRCLDDMKWDLRNALIYFHNYYQKDVIPSEAFL